MINQPILTKCRPHAWDYKPMTWGAFLILEKEAQKVANEIGYPIYIVGSSTYKEIPRDIDLSVIMPLDKYEQMFGKLPDRQEDYPKYLDKVNQISFKFTHHLHFCIDYHLDIKVCPDTWWSEKPKMLLVEPDIYKQYRKIKAYFKPIRTDNLRPEVLSLIGEMFEWQYCYIMDENDVFPGVWALTTRDERFGYWVPEFDLEIISE
ncbi:MAG: hypothetical protein M0P99_00970 [Candidatus Cloacimonetes bacterium]|nr:hypothetical protein [Candidatus Cloacimonadota bacterium]